MRPFAVVIGGVVIVVVVLAMALLYFSSQFRSFQQARIDSFKAHCVAAGGHLYSPDIILCVREDGRLVEVYP